MTGVWTRWSLARALGAFATLMLVLSGCGDSDSSPGAHQSGPSSAGDSGSGSHATPMPPTAAISEQSAPIEFVEPEAGTAQWLIREIVRLRGELTPEQGDEGASTIALGAEARADRLNQIVDLAHQAIAKTHKDPLQEVLFNNAVRFLTDARLELALAGDVQAGDLLVEDATLLHRRDPESFAAAEAGFKVVRLAQLQAEAHEAGDTRWLAEFAKQARLFADRFPGEQSRAAVALLEAGRACDRQGLVEQARGCYETIATQFAETPFAEQVAGCLRRLDLIGHPLDLGGPTIDGGFSSIDQYQGRVVLVVYWSVSSPTFVSNLPQLLKIEEEFRDRGLSIIGVNLDLDESTVDAFMSQHELIWPQIFSPDVSQRGVDSPLARYYGVQSVPTYWLIDRQGVVKQAPAELEHLESSIAQLLDTP